MSSTRIQPNEIQRCVGIVVSRLKMKLDNPIPSDERERILLVEGDTDKRFFERKLKEDVRCFSMGGILKARKVIKEDNQVEDNCKEAVMKTVYGLNVLPQIIIIKGAENWDVYGVIDKDCEEFELYTGSKRLYVTDTHDLETLIVSCDPEVWTRVCNGSIDEGDIRKAYFVAYQLFVIRDAIKSLAKIPIRAAKAGSCDVKFACFVNGEKVSCFKLLEYINEKNKIICPKKALLQEEMEKLNQSILKDKRIKKVLSKDGEFKGSIDEFSIDDHWDKVEGHDILALIRYYNAEAAKKYNHEMLDLNRYFEMDLINCSDEKMFKRTDLYVKMHRDNLIKNY